MVEGIEEILAPYFQRIGRRGGLPRWMNQALNRRPEVPRLLREIVDYYLNAENLSGSRGEVRLTRDRLYHQLAEFRPDWVLRVPHRMAGLVAARGRKGEQAGVPLVIAYESRIPLDQATALGKMVHLLQEGPKGIWGLDQVLLRKIRRARGTHSS